jgi:hypothetical protein
MSHIQRVFRTAFPLWEPRLSRITLSPWRPAAQAGHIGLGPGFIDEDQPPGVDEPLIGSPSFAVATYVRTILLA